MLDMNTETVPSDIQSFALEVLRKLDQGVTINWTDIRLPLVVVFAPIIGSILGGYFFLISENVVRLLP